MEYIHAGGILDSSVTCPLTAGEKVIRNRKSLFFLGTCYVPGIMANADICYLVSSSQKPYFYPHFSGGDNGC